MADLSILCLLVGFVLLEFVMEDFWLWLGEMGSLLLVLRYGLQLQRIYRLVKQAREVHIIRGMGEIDLNDIQVADEIAGDLAPKAQ